MSFKYWMLCITLFIIVLFLAIESYDALTHPLNLMPDKAAAKKSGTRTENSSATGVVTKPTFAVSYNLIAEKNIFSPERKDFQGTGPGSSSKSLIRPEVILYGITIAGDYRSASMISPGRSLKRGERDMMTLRLGERIGEYKLTKVLSDRITLEAQGDTFEVFLYDAKAPKKREGGPPGAPSPAFTPTRTPRAFARTEATEGPKESGEQKTFPSQIPLPVTPTLPPSQIPIPAPPKIPWTGPAPGEIPVPTLPTQIAPSFAPRPVAPPPGTGQPIPLPPGGPMQPPSSGR